LLYGTGKYDGIDDPTAPGEYLFPHEDTGRFFCPLILLGVSQRLSPPAME